MTFRIRRGVEIIHNDTIQDFCLVDLIYWEGLAPPRVIRGCMLGTNDAEIEMTAHRWVDLKQRLLGEASYSFSIVMRSVSCKSVSHEDMAIAVEGCEDIRRVLSDVDSGASGIPLQEVLSEQTLATIAINETIQ